MTAELQLILFGNLQIRQADQDLAPSLSTKAQALLCYLAETGHLHQRASLTGLFWGEKPEDDARRSLRVEFAKMRPLLDEHLDITRQTAQFMRGAPYWLDTEAFSHFLALAQTADAASERSYLRDAVALYRGEFLSGFMLGDATDFEEWILARREHYRQGAIQALTRLTEICLLQKDYKPGIEHALQLVAIDSLLEEGHRQLMHFYWLDGQRSAALRQFESCRALLESELGIEPSAQTRELFDQIRAAEMGQSVVSKRPLPLPPTAAPDIEAPFQAPELVPYFLGRETELAALAALLLNSESLPVVSLVGMGGIGKSSIATQLAHILREQFDDGVLWADAAHSDPASIAARWAGTFGYDFHSLPAPAERFAAVRRLLAEKRLLILLDDVTVAARVKPLLPENGRVAILLTTRSADIAAALGAKIVLLDTLTPDNGRSLLARIIGEERVQAESHAAAQIGQRLQHLPLAMAIAGRYLAARPRRRLDSFAQQLSVEAERLDLSVGDTAVRTSFTISWQALDDEHQRVFSLLAVFNGRHFTAEALAHVADVDAYLALDRLDRLVSLSLLTEEAATHYRQHPLLADFAREKMGDDNQPIHRMVDYFLQLARQSHRQYNLLIPEWENLDAALNLAYRFQRWPDVLNFANTLHSAWFARGRFDWARQAHEWAVAAAQAAKDTALEAQALCRWAQAALEQVNFNLAADLFRRSQALYRQIDDLAGVATCQFELARIALDQNQRYAEAEQLLAESRRIREQLGEPSEVAAVVYRQAKLYMRQSRWDEARRLSLQAFELQESLGQKVEMVRSLRNLVWIYMGMGNALEEAEACADRALAVAQEVEDLGEMALALYCRGAVDRYQKKLDEALQRTRESLELLERMGDKRSIGLVTYLQMLVHRDAGRYEEALKLAGACCEIFTEVEDQQELMWTIGNIGVIHAAQHHYDEARRYYQQSLVMGQSLQDEEWLGLIQERLDSLDALAGAQ